jgi:hypothetical protein
MTLPRTESFVPLTAAVPSGENREFKVTIIPQAEQPRPFQLLEQTTPATGETTAPHGKKNCEPRLSVQRDGGRITSIRIQCNCGQTMDLTCVYDEAPKPS